MIMQVITAYLATAIVFFVIDFIWLSFVAQKFYQREIGPLLLKDFKMGVAAGFYLIYVAGIVVFAVWPALQGGGWSNALIFGAFLGFIAYGTYDLTNYATLKGWTVKMVAVDMAWGASLTGISALFGYFISRAMLG